MHTRRKKGELILNCPLCRETTEVSFKLDVRDPFSKETFKVGVCSKCTFHFIMNPPEASKLSQYYENALGETMHSKSPGLFDQLREILFQKELKPLLGRLNFGDKVCDLGAGDGSLARFIQKRGFESLALDYYSASSQKLDGVTYLQTNLNDAESLKSSLLNGGTVPTAVAMRHVLEHVLQPVETLEVLAEVGVKYLWLVVPNVKSRWVSILGESWYYWDPPRHLTFFSPETLKLAAQKAGYHPLFTKTYGIDEWVTSFYRFGANKGWRPQGWLKHFSPKSPIAALSSAFHSPWGNSVVAGLFELKEPKNFKQV